MNSYIWGLLPLPRIKWWLMDWQDPGWVTGRQHYSASHLFVLLTGWWWCARKPDRRVRRSRDKLQPNYCSPIFYQVLRQNFVFLSGSNCLNSTGTFSINRQTAPDGVKYSHNKRSAQCWYLSFLLSWRSTTKPALIWLVLHQLWREHKATVIVSIIT